MKNHYRVNKNQTHIMSILGSCYKLSGRESDAVAVLNRLLYLKNINQATSHSVARVYSSIGDLEKTFEWLEKSYQERNGEMIWLKLYSEIRDGEVQGKKTCNDPRFQVFLRKIGF